MNMSRREAHCKQILKYMDEHEWITHKDAETFGCMRLSARILELKKQGHVFDREMVYTTDADGFPDKYARYRKVS